MSLSEGDVIQVKEAFKWVMQGLIAKELGGVAVVTKVKSENLPSCFGLLIKFNLVLNSFSFSRVCSRWVWSSVTQRQTATVTFCESAANNSEV